MWSINNISILYPGLDPASPRLPRQLNFGRSFSGVQLDGTNVALIPADLYIANHFADNAMHNFRQQVDLCIERVLKLPVHVKHQLFGRTVVDVVNFSLYVISQFRYLLEEDVYVELLEFLKYVILELGNRIMCFSLINVLVHLILEIQL
uniref:Uncharacterized protein n=1 Tax=Cacopsylla melanoneura TaxID=428564 RepID=A0A8D9E0V7_9HEMI